VQAGSRAANAARSPRESAPSRRPSSSSCVVSMPLRERVGGNAAGTPHGTTQTKKKTHNKSIKEKTRTL